MAGDFMDTVSQWINKIHQLFESAREKVVDKSHFETVFLELLRESVDMIIVSHREANDWLTFYQDWIQPGSRIPLYALEHLEQEMTAFCEDPLQRPVDLVSGVGKTRVKTLNALDIHTIEDMLTYYPRRHDDRSRLLPIAQQKSGETGTVIGSIQSVHEKRIRPGLKIFSAVISDGKDIITGSWFNQSYLSKLFKPGLNILISGKIERRYGAVQMTNPTYEILSADDPIHTGRIVPVYPTTEAMEQKVLRRLVKNCLDRWGDQWQDTVPDELSRKYRLMPRHEAIRQYHFPATGEELSLARRTLAFEELWVLQYGIQRYRYEHKSNHPGIIHVTGRTKFQAFMAAIPYQLTRAQIRVIDEIQSDMGKPYPMNRLLQGDVGSGKTLVAGAAIAVAADGGYQSALLVPTEILAEQHYMTLGNLLEKAGIRVGLLVGSLSSKHKETLYQAIGQGEVDVVIGTHALLQEGISFCRLGLAITDEQHRFGVMQRHKLQEKGYSPDILVMSATPIPRTLALTVFGDLDVSVIDEMPPGRQKIETYWVTPDMRGRIYQFVREKVNAGEQVYVICPLVEESEKLQAEAAVEMAERLQRDVFPDLSVGMVHGRMKSDEKEHAMRAFRNGEVQILVATTVVEVGVDVPNATLIIIEGADRFGLAQLHQLRGRVGRGENLSHCVLVAEPKTEVAIARLNALSRSGDGFFIAEEDLRLRGPGEYLGTRQHGIFGLKVADLIVDQKIMEVARAESIRFLDQGEAVKKEQVRKLLFAYRKRFGVFNKDVSMT
jgi:ATP-dependent DNA helicase RecG